MYNQYSNEYEAKVQIIIDTERKTWKLEAAALLHRKANTRRSVLADPMWWRRNLPYAGSLELSNSFPENEPEIVSSRTDVVDPNCISVCRQNPSLKSKKQELYKVLEENNKLQEKIKDTLEEISRIDATFAFLNCKVATQENEILTTGSFDAIPMSQFYEKDNIETIEGSDLRPILINEDIVPLPKAALTPKCTKILKLLDGPILKLHLEDFSKLVATLEKYREKLITDFEETPSFEKLWLSFKSQLESHTRVGILHKKQKIYSRNYRNNPKKIWQLLGEYIANISSKTICAFKELMSFNAIDENEGQKMLAVNRLLAIAKVMQYCKKCGVKVDQFQSSLKLTKKRPKGTSHILPYELEYFLMVENVEEEVQKLKLILGNEIEVKKTEEEIILEDKLDGIENENRRILEKLIKKIEKEKENNEIKDAKETKELVKQYKELVPGMKAKRKKIIEKEREILGISEEDESI